MKRPVKRLILVAAARTLLGAALVTALVGCKAKPSEAECGQLLDHVMAVEYQGVNDPEALAAVKAEVQADFLDECIRNMPKAKVTCALKAKDKAALAQCDVTAQDRRQAARDADRAKKAAEKAAAEAPPEPEKPPEPPPATLDAGAAPDPTATPDAG